jgi:hypothetical protein
MSVVNEAGEAVHPDDRPAMVEWGDPVTIRRRLITNAARQGMPVRTICAVFGASEHTVVRLARAERAERN